MSAERGAGLPDFLGAIRPRLALLTLLATGPLLALIVVGGLENRATAVSAAERQVEYLARLHAEQQADVIQEAQHLLAVLARVPAVSAFQAAPCHALLRQMQVAHPRIPVLTVARADGSVACSSQGESVPYSLEDRAYFRRTMAGARRTVLSEVVHGRSTRQPTVIVASPIAGSEGATPLGVLAASLNLQAFLQVGAGRVSVGPAAKAVQVVNMQDGTVLAGSLDGVPTASGIQADPAQLAALHAMPEGGMAHVRGGDGVGRIMGHMPLPGTQASIMVSVAVERGAVVAAANKRLAQKLGAALLAAALAVVVVWGAAKRMLVAPLGALAEAAIRVGQGDLQSRPGPSPGTAQELQLLAFTFNEMTLDLQARNRQIASVQSRLRDSEAHHRLMSDNSTDMITRFDAALARTYTSPACTEMLGYAPDELISQPSTSIVHPDDKAHVHQHMFAPLAAGAASARVTFRGVRKDGRCVWLEAAGRPLPDRDGFVVITRDVSERKAMEGQLEEANRLLRMQASQDPLTGVANRRRFDQVLGFEFRRAKRLQKPACVLMLDIDHFKLFNDSHGHPAGDACLRTVAGAITAVLRRPGDMLGRYGGEEFAVVLPHTDASGAMVLAERLRAGVQNLRLPHPGTPAGVVTVSVGVAVIQPPIGLQGPAAFVEAADAALYLAKKAGRNTVRLAATDSALGCAELAQPGKTQVKT